MRELADRLQAARRARSSEDHAFSPRRGRPPGARWPACDLDRDRHVAFVGKLIVSKGVDLLAAAWPLVLREVPDARLVVVGFGAFRDRRSSALLGALAAGDLDAARAIAAGRPRGRGRPARAAAPPARLPRRLARRRGARGLPRRGGRAWASAWCSPGAWSTTSSRRCSPPAEAQVVPSTFPEAFGMVAAEAAACGALPLSAAHSGLAEVSAILAGRGARAGARTAVLRRRATAPCEEIAQRLVAWLRAPGDLRAATREALVAVARERYSWDGVAAGVVAAAEGRHDELVRPPQPGATASPRGPSERIEFRAR